MQFNFVNSVCLEKLGKLDIKVVNFNLSNMSTSRILIGPCLSSVGSQTHRRRH